MRQISLTTQEKFLLESQHKICRDVQLRDRLKVVLLRSEGWATSNIAVATRLHETSVIRHVDQFLNTKKLSPENGGSEGYLSDKETQQLIEHLTEVTYYHNHQICCYIFNEWGIQYSVSGLNKWLHQHGFSYKKPKGVPHKFDEELQAAFIEEYEQLKASVPEDEPILFMDAVHPTQATKLSCGWIRTGEDKVINTTGSRTRLNIIGAIRLGHLAETTTAQYMTINGESIIDFLEKVREKYQTSGAIHLIVDGASYHRSSEVKEKAKTLNIVLHYLPPYSPNLNPIERLWKVMNEHARNNRYFATAKEFRRQIDDFFEFTLPKIGDTLNGRINDNFQTLKSAS
jgi:transposase